MKKILIAGMILAGSVSANATNFSNLEEHTIHGMLAMQEANNKVSSGDVATVGPVNSSCDYNFGTNRIQDAIDSGVPEVRIADGTYFENLIIEDISVTIKGGYDNCSDAASDISNNTLQVIRGDSTSGFPVIRILGSSQRNVVNISGLNLTDGNGTTFVSGGGISAYLADVELNIEKSWLKGNTGIIGGGLAVVEGDTDVTLSDVWIDNNSATEGGGIYCKGSDASVLVSDSGDQHNSGISGNTATAGNGGGVLLIDGCLMTSYSGTSSGGLDYRGISDNQATGNGGGIAVTGGSILNLHGAEFCDFDCIGNNDNPVNVSRNIANSDGIGTGLEIGGGIYIQDVESVANLNNVLIQNNETNSSHGGGIGIKSGTVTVNSVFNNTVFQVDCWSPGSCSQIDGNYAHVGGAIYAESNSTVNIYRTVIMNNRANVGTAIYAEGSNTVIDTESSLIANNGAFGVGGFSDNNAIRLFVGPSATFDFTTIADNSLTDEVIDNLASTINVGSSIIHESNGLTIYNSSSTMGETFHCTMVHDLTGVPSGVTGSYNEANDPEFVDRLNGNFRINASLSPAVDYCHSTVTPPSFGDIDDEQRGLDDPISDNGPGPFDIGFDETYANEIIFADGFNR